MPIGVDAAFITIFFLFFWDARTTNQSPPRHAIVKKRRLITYRSHAVRARKKREDRPEVEDERASEEAGPLLVAVALHGLARSCSLLFLLLHLHVRSLSGREREAAAAAAGEEGREEKAAAAAAAERNGFPGQGRGRSTPRRRLYDWETTQQPP